MTPSVKIERCLRIELPSCKREGLYEIGIQLGFDLAEGRVRVALSYSPGLTPFPFLRFPTLSYVYANELIVVAPS